MTAPGAYAGRVDDLTLREWIAANASDIRELPFVLISSIDSDRRVSSMPWVLAHRLDDPAWALSLFPLVISGESVVRLLADSNLFTGFDELWIPAVMPVLEPPVDASLVAPLELDVESPQAIRAWLDLSKCRLGVGDGYGTNFIVADSALGSRLGLGGPSPERRG